MVPPEARENNTSCDASLLFGSIQTGSVKKAELNPCSGRVAVCKTTLILSPVDVGVIGKLSLVGVSITAIVLEQFFVVFLELLRQVDLSLVLLPFANLTCSPRLWSVVRHFDFVIKIIISLNGTTGFWGFGEIGRAHV